MTTRSKKVKDAKTTMTTGTADAVWYKFGGRGAGAQSMQEADKQVGALAQEGQHIKTQMNALSMELKAVTAKLLELAEAADVPDSGTVNIIVGNRKACSVTYKEDTVVKDVPTLEKKLGKKRFADLTRQSPKPKFHPSENLMDMALKDDEIMACLTTVQKNPAVSYNV